jgi:hypothetical protein
MKCGASDGPAFFCVSGRWETAQLPAPVGTITVILTITTPFTVRTPVGLIDTTTGTPLDVVPLSTKEAVVFCELPSAGKPAVATVRSHGLTVNRLPSSRGPEVKGDEVTLKMHEPYVMVPDARRPPEAMLKVGVAPEPESVSVVVDVVPNAGTPLAKVKVLFSIACTAEGPVAELIGTTVLAAATGGADVLSLLPQAASNMLAPITMPAKANLTNFITASFMKHCTQKASYRQIFPHRLLFSINSLA